MGYALSGGQGWNMGYRYIAILQIVLTAVLFLSLPLWNKNQQSADGAVQAEESPSLSLKEIIGIPGAKEVMITFFCYCAVEQTAGLWASSYLVLCHGLSADTAAGFASLFFVGITIGRAFSGFLTLRFNDTQLIRLGQSVILAGIVLLILPFGTGNVLAGLVMIGLGCAPVYPSIIHSTPAHFGAERSQAMIGVQMASAYVGTCLMPPVFGLIASHISPACLPLYLFLILVLMVLMHEKMLKKIRQF